MKDLHNAFINPDWKKHGSGKGLLSGKRFAVKDLYHIKDHKTSFGNPSWLETHEAAEKDAPVIEKLCAAGAEGHGITHTVEMAFSLIGHNSHYGTPINPATPERDPGGSSSGSAAAVAADYVDFALGSDTSGSVRVPASHCGLFGLRPTHNRIPLEGILPLAPGFDTIGWFSKSPDLLAKIGEILLPNWQQVQIDLSISKKPKLLYPVDIWEQITPRANDALKSIIQRFEDLYGTIKHIRLTRENETIEDWFNANRHVQGWEIWQSHKDWIEKEKPVFSPGVGDRINWARSISYEEFKAGQARRDEVSDHLYHTIGEDYLLILPTIHDCAPKINLPINEMEAYRNAALRITCLSGMTGTPQINLPLANIDGNPYGISLLAWRHHDEILLEIAKNLPQYHK